MTSSPNFWANVTVQKNRQVLRYTVERNQNIFELMERLKENRRWWQDKYPCEAIYVKVKYSFVICYFNSCLTENSFTTMMTYL